MVTLVDTNVLLDLFMADPVWADWSQNELDRAAQLGPLIINPIVFSELAAGFDRCDYLAATLTRMGLVMEELSPEALFKAGKAFQLYRAQRGTKTGVLPDFFIGAHAAVLGVPLLTRDPRRVRTYFPTVDLITPAQLS